LDQNATCAAFCKNINQINCTPPVSDDKNSILGKWYLWFSVVLAIIITLIGVALIYWRFYKKPRHSLILPPLPQKKDYSKIPDRPMCNGCGGIGRIEGYLGSRKSGGGSFFMECPQCSGSGYFSLDQSKKSEKSSERSEKRKEADRLVK